MTQDVLLSFRKEVSLVELSEEQAILEFPWGKATLNELTPGLLTALQTLSSGETTKEQLSEHVLESDGVFALATLYYHLQQCGNLGLLCYRLVADDQPIAIVVPMAPGFQISARSVGANTRFRLSRFAYCRRDEDENSLVLESPLSLVRTIMPGHTGAALVAELVQPQTCPNLCASIEGLAHDAVQTLLSLLVDAAIITEVGADGKLLEDNNPTLAQWEFHDLLFHSRSRLGRHDYPLGGMFPFLDKIPPLPALKPKMSDEVIPLYTPDVDRLRQEDIPFTYVMENRKSIRSYGDQPISIQQLGEFLYRVARVRQLIRPNSAWSLHHEVSNRPYPSGGAAYDLELYVTVDRCVDLPSGIYHYDPSDHQLHRLTDRDAHVEALLRDAQLSAGLSYTPQVLITLSSRFQRLSWKYRGIAYATTLKNVGVLYQTMYLVATAMGLAPCGLGSGNSALFAEAMGTDYFAESSVGEFMLGSTARLSVNVAEED